MAGSPKKKSLQELNPWPLSQLGRYRGPLVLTLRICSMVKDSLVFLMKWCFIKVVSFRFSFCRKPTGLLVWSLWPSYRRCRNSCPSLRRSRTCSNRSGWSRSSPERPRRPSTSPPSPSSSSMPSLLTSRTPTRFLRLVLRASLLFLIGQRWAMFEPFLTLN